MPRAVYPYGWVRRGGAVVSALVLVVGAAAVGARGPGSGLVPPLPGRSSLDYSSSAGPPLAPLSLDYLRRSLPAPVFAALFGTPAAPAPPTTPSSSVARMTRHAPETKGPSLEPSPGPLTSVVGGGRWRLTITATADRATVSRGDRIRYRFLVHNAGRGDFNDLQLHVTFNIPYGTYDSDDGCVSAPNCLSIPVPAPGLPGDNHQGGNGGNYTILSGATLVIPEVVTVEATDKPGQVIDNHAHLCVVSSASPCVSIRSNSVTVTVR